MYEGTCVERRSEGVATRRWRRSGLRLTALAVAAGGTLVALASPLLWTPLAGGSAERAGDRPVPFAPAPAGVADAADVALADGDGSPEAVLWDQSDYDPNGTNVIDQEFGDFPTYSTYQVHDFTVPSPGWNITAVSTYFTTSFGNWSPAITQARINLYPKTGEFPYAAEDPSAGFVVPVTLTNLGSAWKLTADTSGLEAFQNLAPGECWIGLTPIADFGAFGQEFHWLSASPVGTPSAIRNPGGGFGLGTQWGDYSLFGLTPGDGAFLLEGYWSQVQGACCVQDAGGHNLCVYATQVQCVILLQGTYWGDGSPCPHGECPEDPNECDCESPCDSATPQINDQNFPLIFTEDSVVATQFDFGSVPNYVVKITDIKNKPGLPLNTHWAAATRYSHPTWTDTELGSVFGVTVDGDGNIYVTASTCYIWSTLPSGGVPADWGNIYKIDRITGVPTVFATLPNTGPGLGNICFDAHYQQFFVSNFEDGRIYRLDMNGNCLSTWDHAAGIIGTCAPQTGEPNNAFVPLGQRPWGVGVHNNRLYYGIWAEDQGRPSATVANSIWSIGLSAFGQFTGVAQLDVNLPPLAGGYTYSNPPSQLSFSQNGCMLIAERGMGADHRSFAPHYSRVLEYRRIGTTWWPSPLTFGIGVPWAQGATNSAGGADYDKDGYVWATGDALQLGPQIIYGLQGLPCTGGTVANSTLVDLNGNLTQTDKTEIGALKVTCCPKIVRILGEQVRCNCEQPPGSGYTYTYWVQNLTPTPLSQLFFSVTPSVTITPFNPLVFNPAIQPGESRYVPMTITGTNAVPGTRLCFNFSRTDFPSCTEHCITLPECDCVQLRNQSLRCVQPTGTYRLGFQLANLAPCPIGHVILLDDPAAPAAALSKSHFTVALPACAGTPPLSGWLWTDITVTPAPTVPTTLVLHLIALRLDYECCCNLQVSVELPAWGEPGICCYDPCPDAYSSSKWVCGAEECAALGGAFHPNPPPYYFFLCTCPIWQNWNGGAVLGFATVETDDIGNTLRVSDLSDSGEDGVRLESLPANALGATWLDPSGFGDVPLDAYLEARARGMFAGDPDRLFAAARATAVVGGVQLEVDFSPVGAAAHNIAVYNGGALVAQVLNHMGPVALAGQWPTGLDFGQGADITATARWSTPVGVAIPGGPTVEGDRLVVTAVNPNVVFESLRALEIVAASLIELLLTDAVATPVLVVGDLDCDGDVDFGDINPFILALSDPAGYAAAYPQCHLLNGDCDGDGDVDFDDINAFVALLSGS